MEPNHIIGLLVGVMSVAVMLRFPKYFFGEDPIIKKGFHRSRGKVIRKNFL